jgi:hypothetical protein
MEKIHKKVKSLELNRRTFIKATAATTAALSCPALFSGCGNSSGDTESSSDGNTTKHLHFDLSHLEQDEEYTLHIGTLDTYKLTSHTDESRVKHRAFDPSLYSVSDEELTHYVEDVVHPDHVVLRWVTHGAKNRGEGTHALAQVAIHIPENSLNAARRALQEKGLYTAEADTANDSYLTPLDVAKTLVFHHPELMNLDPVFAAKTMAHIESHPEPLNQLAFEIQSQGEAYEYSEIYVDGWAVLEPMLDEDEHRRKDSDGNDVYNYRLSDRTLEGLGPAVQAILRSIKNDPNLEGISWYAVDGTSAIVDDGTGSAVQAGLLAAPAAGQYQVGVSHEGAVAGMTSRVRSVSEETTELASKNWWLRWLGFYVQYLDADGNVLTLLEVKRHGEFAGQFDTEDAQFMGLISGPYTFMGVPIGDIYDKATGDLVEAVTYQIEFPADVSTIRLLYGGLGASGDFDLDIARLGIAMTAVMQYGIPVLMMSLGAPIDGPAQQWFKNVMDSVKANKVVLGIILAAFDTVFSVYKETPLSSVTSFILKKGANIAGNLILKKALSGLRNDIFREVTLAQMAKVAPFAGWAMYAAESAATLGELAQTTAEVFMSPWVIENQLTRTHSIKVSILPDPKDHGFPASATHYRITAIFSEKNHRMMERQMSSTSVSEVAETFEGVPAGGKVEIIVAFYSDTGWLAGKGNSGKVDNLSAQGSDVLNIPPFEIEEFPVPLTVDSEYSHKKKLTYDGSAHVWAAATAPLATRNDLGCSNIGENLCELNGITVNQKNGMLGYAWRASGQGVKDCEAGATGQLHTFQNIHLGEEPDAALKFTNCGFSQRPCLIYDLLGGTDGHHFFIDPRGGEYHLRRVVLDNATPFDFAGSQSYGRFTTFLDSVAIHPNGYVIGVNCYYSKLELLRIPETPYSDDTAPYASLLAGQGTRRGLLHGPRSISVGADGTVFILEEDNRRISAFDLRANPIPHFQNKAYSFSLKQEATTVTYLDMGVEAKGYIYVLSHIGSGYDQNDYHMDIYEPNGHWLVRTTGMAAAQMSVDLWRNVYTLNYETFKGPGGRTEPSVSEWIPATPSASQGYAKSNVLINMLKNITRRRYV